MADQFNTSILQRVENMQDLRTANCPICGDSFVPHREGQECDKLFCKYTKRANWSTDNTLKARFVGQLMSRRLTLRDASREITGNPYSTLRGWLRRDETRLSSATLQKVAPWLALTVNETIRLQGGAAEEHQRAVALAALQSDGVQAHAKRLHDHPALARAQIERMTKAVSGKPQSEKHREGIRKGLKAYRQTPSAHDLGQYHSTPLGKTYQLLRNLLRYRPAYTRRELAEEAVTRLRKPPYDIESDRAARTLVADCALGVWLGHERLPSWQRVTEFADQTGREVGLSRNEVLQCWRARLQKKRLWRDVGGRPKEIQRCRLIREDLNREGVSPTDARAPYRFWKKSAARAPEKDGQQPDAQQQLVFWRGHHCEECQTEIRLRRREP
jgi:hypothetical protein